MMEQPDIQNPNIIAKLLSAFCWAMNVESPQALILLAEVRDGRFEVQQFRSDRGLNPTPMTNRSATTSPMTKTPSTPLPFAPTTE
jgi:hypothetical protein